MRSDENIPLWEVKEWLSIETVNGRQFIQYNSITLFKGFKIGMSESRLTDPERDGIKVGEFEMSLDHAKNFRSKDFLVFGYQKAFEDLQKLKTKTE